MNITEFTPKHAIRAAEFHGEALALIQSYPLLGERLVYYEAEREATTLLSVPLVNPTPPRVLKNIARKLYRLDKITAFETMVGISATSSDHHDLIRLLALLDTMSLDHKATEIHGGEVIYPGTKNSLAWVLGTGYLFEDLKEDA